MNGSPQVLLLDPQQPEQTQLTGYLRRQGYLPLALEDPEALFPQFYRQAPAAMRMQSSTRSCFTLSQASRSETCVETWTTRMFSCMSIMVYFFAPV